MIEALMRCLYRPFPSRAEQHWEFPFSLGALGRLWPSQTLGKFLRTSLRRTNASIYRSLFLCNSPSAAVIEELRTIRAPGNFPNNYGWKLRNVGCVTLFLIEADVTHFLKRRKRLETEKGSCRKYVTGLSRSRKKTVMR